ncbi:MAG: immunoglobulin domain-containing protein [Bacteroidales bacterium]|nr:immunoglobulin domain-containing protein [Bacteroidales bacterium]
MSTDLAHVTPETKPKSRWWNIGGTLLVVILIGIGWYYHQSKAPSLPVVHIRCSPEMLSAEGLTLGISEIIIDPNRSFLSGNHPTVTFHGTAHSDKEKIKYAQFAYNTQKHPQRYIVDATRHKGDDFSVKIRDLEPGDIGVCHFVVTTRHNKHVSQPVTFRIPKK